MIDGIGVTGMALQYGFAIMFTSLAFVLLVVHWKRNEASFSQQAAEEMLEDERE